jgi:hypothetical protein
MSLRVKDQVVAFWKTHYAFYVSAYWNDGTIMANDYLVKCLVTEIQKMERQELEDALLLKDPNGSEEASVMSWNIPDPHTDPLIKRPGQLSVSLRPLPNHTTTHTVGITWPAAGTPRIWGLRARSYPSVPHSVDLSSPRPSTVSLGTDWIGGGTASGVSNPATLTGADWHAA